MRKNERGPSMNRPTPDPSQDGNGAGMSDRWLSSVEGRGVGSASVSTCEWTSRFPGIRWTAVSFGLALLLSLNARAFVVQLNTNGEALRWHLDPPDPFVDTNLVNPVSKAIRFFLAADAYSATN